MTLSSISLRARDVAEHPGDVRLRRPQRSVDIRTVRTRQGSNIQIRRYPTDISFFCIIESTRRRRTSGRRSPATTAAERRHSNCSNPAGLEHTKKDIHRMSLFCISLRARDGIRTLPMSGKLLKSRRNAHCLTCVYRLSTT